MNTATILQKIIEQKHLEIARDSAITSLAALELRAKVISDRRDFIGALQK